MLLDQRQRSRRVARDRAGDRLDMTNFARRSPHRQRRRAFSRRPRLPDPRLQLQEPGARDLRQREIGVGGERPLQPGIGPGGGRQQQIDRRDVIGDRLGRGCGHRELETVGHPHLHDSPS
jgi:hypothetical protein